MTPRQRILVFVIAGVSAVAGLGVFGYVVYRTITDVRQGAVAPPEEDRKLVVTGEDLERLGVLTFDPAYETFSSTKAFDGSRTVEYQYTTPPDEEGDRIYWTSTTQVFPQALTTMQMFKMQQVGFRGGLAVAGGVKAVPKPHLLETGDGQYAAELQRKDSGEWVGNLFMVRQGRVLHTVIITGMAFDTAEEVETVLAPSLEEAKRRFLKR